LEETKVEVRKEEEEEMTTRNKEKAYPFYKGTADPLGG
jgi:hypothetical protein